MKLRELKLACGAGAALALGLFWLRAGSVHAPLDRIWRLIFGKSEVHDPIIKALLQESRDIERYNCSFRPKARSKQDIHKMDQWRQAHGLGMAELRKVSGWLDFDFPELLRQPSKKYIPCCVIVAVLAYAVMVGIAPISSTRYSYFQANTSKVWFKTNAQVVKAPFESWSFDSAKCSGDRAAISDMTGLNHSEVDLICKNLDTNADEFKSRVDQALKSQRWTGGCIMVFAFVAIIISVLLARSASDALKLRARLFPSVDTSADERWLQVTTES